jgi:hypothetical protein
MSNYHFEFESGLHNFQLQGFTPAFSVPAVKQSIKSFPSNSLEVDRTAKSQISLNMGLSKQYDRQNRIHERRRNR